MINKIIGTVGTRVYAGLVLLIILGLHSKNLGAQILGELAIFRFALTINHLFSSVFSAPIVFVSNRISINKLILPTICWILFCSIILSVIQVYSNLVEIRHLYHLFFLSLLFSSQTFLEQVLLGKQQIKLYNISAFLYHSILLGTTLFLIFGLNQFTEEVFFYAMYAALISSNIFLVISVGNHFSPSQFTFKIKIAKILFHFGFWVQLANFSQTLNYRIGLLLIDFYWGKKVVGYFSAALQLAEAIWIIAKSLATVQYSKIANTKSKPIAIDLTLIFSKVSFVISLIAALVLIIIPEKTIGYYLGKDFSHVKETILYMMPGILFFSISIIYSHYFSGIGRVAINTIGSIISLVIIVIGGLLFIPAYGQHAAALVNSAGLFTMLIYNILVFVRSEKVEFRRLFPAKNDFKKSITILKEYLKIT